MTRMTAADDACYLPPYLFTVINVLVLLLQKM